MTKLSLTTTLFALSSAVAGSACVTTPEDPTAAEPAAAPVARETHGADACPANTPAALAPAADADLAFALNAQGVQRYACVASTTGYAWTFVAPAADLFSDDPHGFAVHHFAGPTWLARDSSSVLGTKVAASTVDATAIPWLLLNVASHGGEDGTLTDITAIQRLATTGGLAPATGCDANHVGMQSDVLYTARYFFYRSAPNVAHRVRCGG